MGEEGWQGAPGTQRHLAVAFDTFESYVAPDDSAEASWEAAFIRLRADVVLRTRLREPSRSGVAEPDLEATEGEKHPADRAHTDRLGRMQQVIQRCVARHLGVQGRSLVLKTEISPEKADNLHHLHRLCDWVITLDRNAGIEYFDSPRDNREIYDAYVIDCVPEREDLGCLQLITSTSNLEEVRRLLDRALDQMGLSRSRRNARIPDGTPESPQRPTGDSPHGPEGPTSELIALAFCHAHARLTGGDTNPCWPSLRTGFLIPVNDVQDLMPPANAGDTDAVKGEEGRAVRPDLIHVSIVTRSGLLFRFIEVKYRRNLRDARTPEVLNTIKNQVESLGDGGRIGTPAKRWLLHSGQCAARNSPASCGFTPIRPAGTRTTNSAQGYPRRLTWLSSLRSIG